MQKGTTIKFYDCLIDLQETEVIMWFSFLQRVYYREPPPAYKVSYSWDVPIVVISQDDLSFDKTSPLFVMQPGAKDTKAKNVTVRLTATGNQFVIVNPEEIGIIQLLLLLPRAIIYSSTKSYFFSYSPITFMFALLKSR